MQETANRQVYHYHYGYVSGLELAVKEVRWILLQSCQCALPHHFTSPVGYFTCAPSGYAIFRVRFSSPMAYDSSIDLTVLKANLTRFITGNGRNVQITISGGGYFVSPGPCGVTVPDLDFPHCFNDSGDFEDTPSQPIISTTRQDNTTAATTNDSAQPVVIMQDNTAVVAIVAAMCGATLILVLSACILILILFVRVKKM